MSKRTRMLKTLLALCLLALVLVRAVGLTDAGFEGSKVQRFKGFQIDVTLEPGTFKPATFEPATAVPYVSGEILVLWRDEVTAAAARAAVRLEGLTVLQEIPSLRAARLAVPPGQEWVHVERLRQHPLVAYAEPNYLAYAADEDVHPNDPHWPKQWNMRCIEAPAAWALSTGKPDLVVAVLDSGVDADHPDLSANLLAGYDFVNQDADPNDDYGHGTHVTGIIAAQLDNEVGVAGVTPRVSILPLKVLNDRGEGSYANIAAAIQYAAANGAAIINLSLGGASYSETLQQAVHNAYEAGALLAASTGNNGSSSVTYPARYAEVLAISATDRYDQWASYSNWGPEVDLAAPGGVSADQVWSTWPGGYDWEYGTSMAVPHVAGAAALIWSVDPTLTRDEVADLLRQTADQVGEFPYIGERNDYLGHGRLNAHQALRQTLPPSLAVEPAQLLFLGDSQQAPAAQQLTLSNESYQPLQWEAEKLSGGSWLNLIPPLSGTISYQDPDKLTVMTIGGLDYGVYEGSLRISSSTPGAQGSPRTVPVRLSLVPELTHLYLPVVENGHTTF